MNEYESIQNHQEKSINQLRHINDVDIQNNQGQTPLIYAAKYFPKAISLLLEKGSNINQEDRNGDTALVIYL